MAAAAAPAKTAAGASIGAGEIRQQSSTADAQNTHLSLPSWLPGMEDIRAAHLAQASALESMVAALVSKQQSSIAALKRQMDAITSGQVRSARVSGTKVSADTNASDGDGGSGGDVRETPATNGANEDVVSKDLAETTHIFSEDGQDNIRYRGMSDEQQLQQGKTMRRRNDPRRAYCRGAAVVQVLIDMLLATYVHRHCLGKSKLLQCPVVQPWRSLHASFST